MSSNRNLALDYLRIFACVWVFAFHWTGHSSFKNDLGHGYLFTWQPEWFLLLTNHGNLGVDIFFIISGLVIGKSLRNTSPQKFAMARFLRLYPVFLVATLLTLLVAPPIIGGGYLSYIYTISGLQFFLKTPILIADSWTLEYEIIFYFLMYLFLLYCSKKGIDITNSILRNLSYSYFLVYLLTTAVKTEFTEFVFRLDGLSIYFILGLFLSTLQTKLDFKRNSLPLFFMLTVTYHQVLNRVGDPSSRFYAYLCLLFVIAVTAYLYVAITRTISSIRSVAFIKKASLMTYPFYLLHETFGLSLAITLVQTGLNPALSLSLVLVILIILSFIITAYIEPKVRKVLDFRRY
jgi:peptidoglycan/LPS O-acetylase OafA/YrhL